MAKVHLALCPQHHPLPEFNFCWWTLRLFHISAVVNTLLRIWGYRYFFVILSSFSLDIYSEVGLLDYMVILFLIFLNFILLLLFYFIILYWFCHTSTWIHHGCTCVPTPEPPSHLPPHTIPLAHPSTPTSSILYPASNLDWWFISYMILYMFQCHSPKSSYPLPLPQSPKDFSIHLCLFCCLALRFF